MASGPRSLNLVSLLLLACVAALGYATWKFFPVYFTAWQVDHLLADGGARAYQLARAPEPDRSVRKAALIEQLRHEVRALGVLDPKMTVSLDFVGNQFVDATCGYDVYVLHPVGDRFTHLTMHRAARTSLARPSWDESH